MKYTKFIIIVSLLLSCGKKEVIEIKTQVLTPERVIEDFGEGVYFTHVAFSSDSKGISVINLSPATLFVLDKDFNLKHLMENRGDGPGSLSYPINLIYTKHGLMVQDLGNNRISIFDPHNGAFLDQIRIPDAISTSRFFYSGDGLLYFPIKGHESDSASVLKINTSGEIIKRIGQIMPQENGDFNRQARLIQPFEENHLILIGINLTFLDVVNSEGELVKRHRLDLFEPLKRALDSLENDFVKPGYERGIKEVKHIVIDAQYLDGKLYLTFTDRIGLNRSNARHLLEFNLSKESLVLNRVFRFQTGTPDDDLHPFAFHVDHHAKKIYTQGLITQNIYVFDLPD